MHSLITRVPIDINVRQEKLQFLEIVDLYEFLAVRLASIGFLYSTSDENKTPSVAGVARLLIALKCRF